MIEGIGLLAAVLTASSFVPQVWKIIKTRETEGVSRRTYLMTVAASTLWVAYGFGISSLSVILCNSVLGILAMTIVVLKARFG